MNTEVASTVVEPRTTTGAVAATIGAELIGPADLLLTRVSGLEDADERTLSFIRDERNAARWAESRAAAAVVSRRAQPKTHDPSRRALLIVEDADQAMIGILEAIAPRHAAPPAGVHATACVDASARIDPTAHIGPGVVIGAEARVGARTILHARVALGAGARIGADCDLRAGVVIEDRCVVGARVVIHPNTVIGGDGFGYRPAGASAREGGPALIRIPHAGIVEVHDDVEIGACTAIDRGKFGSTVIGAGTKIDNLVQIGHNCRIGRNCVICGAVGLAGSVTLGDGVTLGGGVGVKDNLTLGAGSTVAARSGVMDEIPPGETWAGYPAAPFSQMMRIVAATRKLPDVLRSLGRGQAPAAEKERESRP